MEGTSDRGAADTYEEEGGLDPRDAAMLLDRTGGAAQIGATAGVTGRSVTQQRAEGAGLAVALVAVYVVMGALINEGASDAIVYGLYVVTAPLIVMGAFWAGRSAVREDWQGLGISIAIMLVAAGSAFAGPRGVWLSDGVGCCVVLLGDSAIRAWTLHASRKGT
jgi:hypothetical protein